MKKHDAGELISGVKREGERLLADPCRENIDSYRETLRKLLAYIAENAYSIERETERKIDRRKMPPFNRIEIVRERLVSTGKIDDDIVAALFEQQKKQLEILGKQGNPEGLLLNLDR